MYPRKQLTSEDIECFYQFALNHKKVICSLEDIGFKTIEVVPFDGIKGFKDEVSIFKPYFQKMYDGKSSQKYRPFFDFVFRKFASHCVLLVMKKEE